MAEAIGFLACIGLLVANCCFAAKKNRSALGFFPLFSTILITSLPSKPPRPAKGVS